MDTQDKKTFVTDAIKGQQELLGQEFEASARTLMNGISRQAAQKFLKEAAAPVEREYRMIHLLENIARELQAQRDDLARERSERQAALDEQHARVEAVEKELRQLKMRGRPTPWPLVLAEFDRRIKSGTRWRSQNDCGRTLEAWLKSGHGDHMTFKSIVSRLRKERKEALAKAIGQNASRKSRKVK